MIPYGKQSISQDDIDAVIEVLRSDFLTQGPKVAEFERTVAGYSGARYAVAVNSGTSALHIACLALGLGPGDTLWTTPITFAASANCALYCGAGIDFVDIDRDTFNLSPAALEIKLEKAKKTANLPKIVIPVHMCGQPCDMEAIHSLSKKYGFMIIEDACHALGGQYKNESVGNCSYSDITVFSFHPVKIITTGEGGMAVTNDSGLEERMRLLLEHGISRGRKSEVRGQKSEVRSPRSEVRGPRFGIPTTDYGSRTPDYYYEQIALGFNYRMTDIQAALGISQMRRLNEFVTRRRELACRYNELLAGMPLKIPWQHLEGDSAWHLYVIRLELEKINKSRRQVFEDMRSLGMGVNVHYIPVHTHPYYQAMGFKPAMFPEAEKYYLEALTLPLYPAMTGEEQDRVMEALYSVFRGPGLRF